MRARHFLLWAAACLLSPPSSSQAALDAGETSAGPREPLPVSEHLVGIHDGVHVCLMPREGPSRGKVQEVLSIGDVLERLEKEKQERSDRLWDILDADRRSSGGGRLKGWAARRAAVAEVKALRKLSDQTDANVSSWEQLLKPWFEASWRPDSSEPEVYRLWQALVDGDDAKVEGLLAELRLGGKLVYSQPVSGADSDDPDYVGAAMLGGGKPIYTIGPLNRRIASALEAVGLPPMPRPYANVLPWPIENVQQHVLPRGGKALVLLMKGDVAGPQDHAHRLYVIDSGPGFPVLRAMNKEYHDPKYHERGEALGYMIDGKPRSWVIASHQREFRPKMIGDRYEIRPGEGLPKPRAGYDALKKTPSSGALFSISWP